MLNEKQKRLLELALESLGNKKKQIEQEIEELTRELGSARGRKAAVMSGAAEAPFVVRKVRKRPRFSKEERLRRSARMKAYWENWRKQRARGK